MGLKGAIAVNVSFTSSLLNHMRLQGNRITTHNDPLCHSNRALRQAQDRLRDEESSDAPAFAGQRSLENRRPLEIPQSQAPSE